MASHLSKEDGFTVVELTIALVIIGIIILMTVGPTSTGFNLLDRSKVKTIESNLAQGRIEEIRSLSYKDVGYTASVPSGVLEPSETVTVSGASYTVDTDVSYFGSASGGNVIPQGGDGVEGHYNSGIDFKQVVVTVQRSDGSYTPVKMTTIVAPPSLAANDNLSNVIVDLTKVEPAGKDPSILPYPKAFLVYDDDSGSIAHPGSSSDEQVFVGVDSNAESSPKYYYYGRLGAHLSDTSSSTVHWYLYPEDLTSGSDRVHVSPTETGNMNLRIYLPAELHVALEDSSDGSPVSGTGTLVLNGPTGDHTFTPSDPEWNGSGWDIEEIDGYPLVPGDYSFDIHILGYGEVLRPNVTVPAGYPDVTDHTETFSLDAASGSTLTVHVLDGVGVKLSDVDVDVTDLNGTTTYTTDGTGTVSAFIEGLNPLVTVDVSSHYGHSSATQSVLLTGDAEITIALSTPSGYGLITFTDNNLGVDHYEYLPRRGSPDDTVSVFPNVDGLGSAAVEDGRWKVTKVCFDGTRITQGSGWRSSPLNVGSGDHVVWSTYGSQTCPAP